MYCNPAELVFLDAEPVTRLLRAAGTDERILQNGSDYDRFSALAAAMPLCRGNTLANTLQTALQEATGLTKPLCLHTAPVYWKRWTDKYWYGKTRLSDEADIPCDCTPHLPVRLLFADVTRLPAPEMFPQGDLAAATARLQALLPIGGYALFCLPADYTFRRPDPYHAAQALRRAADRHQADRDLLIGQALRILGETARARAVTLILTGGTPDAVTSLLSYLFACGRLPHMAWLPYDPAEVSGVSGLYAEVATGYVLPKNTPPAEAEQKQTAYAAVAPIGRAFIYTET